MVHSTELQNSLTNPGLQEIELQVQNFKLFYISSLLGNKNFYILSNFLSFELDINITLTLELKKMGSERLSNLAKFTKTSRL